jgi:tetraacyldisaccharide 4'-kinase
MLRAPAFWSAKAEADGIAPWLLRPFSAWVTALTARRVRRQGWRAPVPVICCGNATVGGAGKTTLALDLGRRLIMRRRAVHFLARGYRGSVRGPHRVTAADDAAAVGDEALLLAAVAPTWVGADRAASAREAVANGADVLILDDGLQNPTLVKDLSLLVIDGGFGFGNGRVLPAGPLREPPVAAAARCEAAVLIGSDETGALAAMPASLPVLRAALAPGPELAALAGRAVVAFAGIARPEKFFATLTTAGAELVAHRKFPDHHRFSAATLNDLRQEAARLHALLVTTPKDAARLAPGQRNDVLAAGVILAWENPAVIERWLDHALAARTDSSSQRRLPPGAVPANSSLFNL